MVKVAVIFWFEKVAGEILYFGVLKHLLWLSLKIQGAQLGRTPYNVKGHLTDGIVLLIVVGGSRTSCDQVDGQTFHRHQSCTTDLILTLHLMQLILIFV
jgi:hypothetical protein